MVPIGVLPLSALVSFMCEGTPKMIVQQRQKVTLGTRQSLGIGWILSVILGAFLFPHTVMGGYWTNAVTFPYTREYVPEEAFAPDWSGKLNVLGVVQLQDDLGRQQAVELDKLSQRVEQRIHVLVFSIDTYQGEWTKGYVEQVRRDRKIGLPIYFLSPEKAKGVFERFEVGYVRTLPQVLLLDWEGSVLRVLKGMRTAEEIEGAIAELESCQESPFKELPSGAEVETFQNGDFEDWSQDTPTVPSGWGIHATTGETCLKATEKGWIRSTALEVRADEEGARQVVYQLIPHGSLLGKKLRLSATARGNCVAKPVVALAMAYPRVEEGLRFAPLSPFRVSQDSDRRVPMRIIAACDFEADTSCWQVLESEAVIPADTRALAVLIYLNNPTASGGAAYVDEVRLQYVDENP